MKLCATSWPSPSKANSSISAAPMPWAMPPSVMPRTMSGLITVPQSWPMT